MNILSRRFELFFSSSAKPSADGVTPRDAEQPEAPKPSKVYTDDEIAGVLRRGQAVKAMFDDALTKAKQSAIRKERMACLEIARARLATLKHYTVEFPFFHLTNLPAVEASMLAIETESCGMDDDELTERTTSSAMRYSENDEAGMLDSMQTSFKVIIESIALARNSKNLDTKVSRLRVARIRLTEARTQAARFSLDVRGFDEVEIEINRIEEALRNGTPTEIDGILHIEEPTLASEAYSLLREATVLKRARRFLDACDKLRQAYAAPGAENLMIEDRLRLPMYLQLAGRNDDGWDELNRLATQYTDPFFTTENCAPARRFSPQRKQRERHEPRESCKALRRKNARHGVRFICRFNHRVTTCADAWLHERHLQRDAIPRDPSTAYAVARHTPTWRTVSVVRW